MPPAGAARPAADRAVTGRPRLAVLDGLRLVAALSVAVFHYTVAWRVDGVSPPQFYLPTAAHLTVYGFLGVEFFFLISGFVICMSSWGRPLGDFFVSRVSRLYPAYWVCIPITALVMTLLPVHGGVPQVTKLRLTDMVVNLTMVQQPLGVPSVDTVYWTLFTELRFYLLFALVVRLGLTYRRVVLFCAVWMTVALLAPVLSSPLVTALVVPEYAGYFVAGVAMYLIHRFGRSPLLLAIVGFTWLVNLHQVEQRVAAITPGFTVPTWPGAVLITAAYAVLLAVALGWTDRITWRWLTVAGVVTYPFYLLHQRIGYSVMRAVHGYAAPPVWLLIAGTLLGVAVLAWLVHRWVERPLAARLRKALRRSLVELRQPEPEPAADVAGPPTPIAPDPTPVLVPAGGERVTG